MVSSSFFVPAHASAPQVARRDQDYSIIDVGNDPFFALAVAVIDLMQHSSKINDLTLKKILAPLYAHYPKYRVDQAYLTPAERMTMLIGNARKSDLVECFAYVLRQLLVDEFYANPLDYRDVFHGLSRETSQSYLRQTSTAIPLQALRGIANVLDIKLILSITKPEKELRRREIYTSGTLTHKPEVTLHIHGDKCFPAVRRKADFAYVGQLAINPPQPENVTESAENLAHIKQMIADANCSKWQSTLMSMFNAGDLTPKQVLEMYIEFLPESDPTLKQPSLPVSNVTQSYENAIVEKRINALAEGMTLGQINPDSLFDRLEEPKSRMAL